MGKVERILMLASMTSLSAAFTVVAVLVGSLYWNAESAGLIGVGVGLFLAFGIMMAWMTVLGLALKSDENAFGEAFGPAFIAYLFGFFPTANYVYESYKVSRWPSGFLGDIAVVVILGLYPFYPFISLLLFQHYYERMYATRYERVRRLVGGAGV